MTNKTLDQLTALTTPAGTDLLPILRPATAVLQNLSWSNLIAGVQSALTTLLVPSGAIMLWSGSVASIPSGYYLCNGLNGTPNLQDRFIAGAGSTYNPGDTGGLATQTVTIAGTALTPAQLAAHSHTATDSGHGHSLSGSFTGVTINDAGHVHGLDGGAPFAMYQAGAAFSQAGASFGNAAAFNTDTATSNTSISDPGHGHTLGAGNANISVSNTGSGATHTHAATATTNLPPYYALCYIMKS